MLIFITPEQLSPLPPHHDACLKAKQACFLVFVGGQPFTVKEKKTSFVE
jgi:hypothetical protein